MCSGQAYVLTFTITSPWANSADDKLMTLFVFFPENRIQHFMQIVSVRHNVHEISNPVFLGKIRNIFQYVVC